jgi:hypothetical protein
MFRKKLLRNLNPSSRQANGAGLTLHGTSGNVADSAWSFIGLKPEFRGTRVSVAFPRMSDNFRVSNDIDDPVTSMPAQRDDNFSGKTSHASPENAHRRRMLYKRIAQQAPSIDWLSQAVQNAKKK